MKWLMIACLIGCGGDDSATTDGGNNGSGSNTGSGTVSAKAFCVSETNRYRAMIPVAAVTENTALETYADTGASTDYNASSAHSHFTATGGGGIAFAENECPGFSGWHLAAGGDLNALVGQCIAAFYAEGPGSDYSTHGHYINMTNPSYSTLGCGIDQASNGDVTIVQDYGN